MCKHIANIVRFIGRNAVECIDLIGPFFDQPSTHILPLAPSDELVAMADEEQFLDEIAPFLDAVVHESLPEPWSVVGEQSESSVPAGGCAPFADLAALDQASFEKDAFPINDASSVRPSSSNGGTGEYELAQLRMHSDQLHEHTTALRTQQHGRAGMQGVMPPTPSNAPWEQIVQYRLDELMQHETENAQHKKQVEVQNAVGRNLYRSRHYVSSADGTVSDTPSAITLADPKVCVTPEDIANYDMLFEEIDPAYSLLDRIHGESGLSSWQFDASAPSTSYAQIKTRRSSLGDEAQFIELINSDVVLHDFELTYQLSWYAWELMYFAKNCVAYDDKPASVIAYKWRTEMPLDGEPVMLEYLNATKWYREDNRICCVWRSISTVESHFPGIFVDETGWQVLKPVMLFEQEHNDVPVGSGTAMLTSTHMECRRFDDATSVSFDEVQARQLVNIVASAFQEDLRKVHTLIVNMFVHDPRVAAPVLC
ncbi:hypothetical protein FI667_g11920, partial [Globisporangium splendens]